MVHTGGWGVSFWLWHVQGGDVVEDTQLAPLAVVRFRYVGVGHAATASSLFIVIRYCCIIYIR